MRLSTWLQDNSGIAHRSVLYRAGFSGHEIRRAVESGAVQRLRRDWIAVPECDSELRIAALVGGRLSCVTLAARLGLWVVDDGMTHVAMHPNAMTRKHPTPICRHWNITPVQLGRHVLIDALENALVLIAGCQTFENAVVVFDSVLRQKRLSHEQISRLRVPSTRFRAVLQATSHLSDSGIESLPRVRLAMHGVEMRQQVLLNGHRVDGLIGERLVVQINGDGPHSSRSQRDADALEDAQLMLMGFRVLRFTYTQVMFSWDYVEATVLSAMAQGLHR